MSTFRLQRSVHLSLSESNRGGMAPCITWHGMAFTPQVAEVSPTLISTCVSTESLLSFERIESEVMMAGSGTSRCILLLRSP